RAPAAASLATTVPWKMKIRPAGRDEFRTSSIRVTGCVSSCCRVVLLGPHTVTATGSPASMLVTAAGAAAGPAAVHVNAAEPGLSTNVCTVGFAPRSVTPAGLPERTWTVTEVAPATGVETTTPRKMYFVLCGIFDVGAAF